MVEVDSQDRKLVFAPSCLCRPLRNLPALFGRQLRRPRLATLLPAESPEFHRRRVLLRRVRIGLRRSLTGRLIDDLLRQFVRVARSLLRHARIVPDRASMATTISGKSERPRILRPSALDGPRYGVYCQLLQTGTLRLDSDNLRNRLCATVCSKRMPGDRRLSFGDAIWRTTFQMQTMT